jgi:O-antigen/teichoic acid export membrane protein
VKTWIWKWIKTNSTMLMNSSSLIGTMVVTSLLGFVYWVVAARFFPPHVLGFASATISAMTLLGFFCTLGWGTLLMGELSRQPGKEGSLISAVLILVGGVGGLLGIAFALIAPFVSADFQSLRTNVGDIALFAIGVSLTAMTLVLDGAFVGLLQSELQLWRNALFAVIKLAALFLAGIWLSHALGLTIYATWAIGNAFSLVVLGGLAFLRGKRQARVYLPHWRLLWRLGPAAFQHHLLNLILDVPSLALPLIVTITLSATMNAWFYVSYMLASFAYGVPFALTLVLFAMSSDQPSTLAHKARLTVSLSFIVIILGNCLLQLGTQQFLGLFGHIYAEQAAQSLRILGLAAFPIIIKNHYIAINRTLHRMVYAILPIAIGTLLELGGAALGARLGGISGLSLGWLTALCLEAAFMSRTVYKAIRPEVPSTGGEQLKQGALYPNGKYITEAHSNEASFD